MLNNEDINILNFIIEHSTYIDISIRELAKCVIAWIDNDKEGIINATKTVNRAESDANDLKIKVVNRVSKGQASLHRTDFLRLILQMDAIPDYIEGASSRTLLMSERSNYKPDAEFSAKIKELLDNIIKMGSNLKSTVKSIIDNPGKTPKYCAEIDKGEEKVDASYRGIESYLLNSEIDIKLILQIKNIMWHIEEAGDYIHEVGDSIRIIVATI